MVWKDRTKIILLDILLSGYDFISDIYIAIDYSNRCFYFWTACAVVFTILPSISLFAQDFFSNRLSFKRLLTAIFIQPITVYRATKCLIDPENLEYKNEFWELKFHEVAYESMMQFILQTHVIIHKGLPQTKSTFANVMAVTSIVASLISMWYGTTYQWLHIQYGVEPTISERLKLMFLSLVDLSARIFFCVILFAAIHREGLVVFTLFGLSYPILLCLRRDPTIKVTSDIIPAFNPIFHQNTGNVAQPSDQTLKKVRIDMKMFYNMLMVILLSIMMLVYFAIDQEYHCNEQRTFCFFYFYEAYSSKQNITCPECGKQFWADPVCKPLRLSEDMTFKVMFPIMYLLILISTMEVVQYRMTRSTWMDWILKRTRELSSRENREDGQSGRVEGRENPLSYGIVIYQSKKNVAKIESTKSN